MKTAHVAAWVSSSGAIELLEPLPEEFRSSDVEIVVYGRSEGTPRLDPWDVLALHSFFEDDDEEDAIYDEIE